MFATAAPALANASDLSLVCAVLKADFIWGMCIKHCNTLETFPLLPFRAHVQPDRHGLFKYKVMLMTWT